MKASDIIPKKPVWKQIAESDLPPATKVPIELVKHLERLSLVNFEDAKAVKRLESAIRFADQILLVDTDNVEPLVSVLEDIELPMRNDEFTETDSNIVSLAKEVFEGYYVAPTGNIAYDGTDITDIECERDVRKSIPENILKSE